MVKEIGLITFAYLILSSCGFPKSNNEIVFSCIHCKGCIQRQLNFIEQNSLDKKYKLILDTNCISKTLFLDQINYTHKNNEEIFSKYGAFGNVLFIDSVGQKVELLTNMNLSDYIEGINGTKEW